MSRALPLYSPTPRRLRRPNHPNLFLLGFSSKLILWQLLSLKIVLENARGRAGRQAAGPGHGRPPALRGGSGRLKPGGESSWDGGPGRPAGRKRQNSEPPKSLKSPCWRVLDRLAGPFRVDRDQYWSREKPAPVPGGTWVLPSPWLWGGGQTYWITHEGGRPKP